VQLRQPKLEVDCGPLAASFFGLAHKKGYRVRTSSR